MHALKRIAIIRIAPVSRFITVAIVLRTKPKGQQEQAQRSLRKTFVAYPFFCDTGFVRIILTVTNRGSVTLPSKLRHQLGLKGDDQLLAEITPEGLLLRPAVTLPVEIYSDERIREFDESERELDFALHRKAARRNAPPIE